jgi:NAD(P)-dependent dehydrogenase (short-subunit alcohol dehydrogenase family)
MKKIVLLTGSPGRLGSAFCEKYYDDYYVIGVARKKQANFAHEFISADITTEAENIVNQILKKHKRIDILVNNAATYAIKELSDLPPEEMLNLFNINVVAPHALTRLVLNNFWWNRADRNESLNRCVINVSSISSTHVYPKQGAYAASKAALDMLSKHQARELAQYKVRVAVLSPTSFPRLVSCEEVADALHKLIQSQKTFLEVLEKSDDKRLASK